MKKNIFFLESDVGEGIFFVGLKHVAIKVVASYTEDQIITSNPAQLAAIKEAKREVAAASAANATSMAQEETILTRPPTASSSTGALVK